VFTKRPEPDEFEVTLFGPGVGESVVIHLGANEWLIVDSCRGQHGPAALEYLRNLGVDTAVEVKLIVATHWHNDHVRGLYEVVKACPAAQFFCSSALFSEELLALAELWDETDRDRSAVSELYRIAQLLGQQAEAAGRIKFATANRRIRRRDYAVSNNTHQCEVYSLSPSDFEIQRAQQSLAALLPAARSTPVLPQERLPNDTSVVLHIRSGKLTVLLGADLEDDPVVHTGWNVILDSPERPPQRASCYKVSHHGSYTGDHPRIWSELLTADPYAILTPFNSGSWPLPQASDITRICRHTANAYITSTPRQRSRRSRTGAVGKAIHQRVRRIWTVDDAWSYVQLRRNLDALSDWRLELGTGATRLQEAA